MMCVGNTCNISVAGRGMTAVTMRLLIGNHVEIQPVVAVLIPARQPPQEARNRATVRSDSVRRCHDRRT